MKTLKELRAFCEGYLEGLMACNAIIPDMDDWVVWNEYDINFIGAEYSGHVRNDTDLYCVVYPAGWVDNLPEPLHSFTIKGESK
jgi:hypothetical protein